MSIRPKSHSKYYVVLPAFNEELYLDKVLTDLKKHTSNIVVVDDGSSDKTTQVALRHTSLVITHTLNLGKGAAMKTGADFVFSHLSGKAVIFMDSDAQHDPSEVRHFFTAFDQGHSLIFGVRDITTKMPKFRAVANGFASFLVKLFFGTYIPDIPSGYKGMTKKVYERLRWEARSYDIEMEIAARTARLNLNFLTVPIRTIYLDTDKGMTFLDAGRMITRLFEWKIRL